MIAKLNNGVLSFAPNKITFANPEPQMLKDYAGFKEYVEQEKPAYDAQTQTLTPVYTENETQIVCCWNLQDIPPETEEETNGV